MLTDREAPRKSGGWVEEITAGKRKSCRWQETAKAISATLKTHSYNGRNI